MIKYLFIVVNSLSLFLFGLFSGDNGITVTSNIPANIHAGEEIAIELKVNKGGMNGFAKLQLELPEGFSIKESEDKGANYSYNAGIAKWVWAALPMESEIVVKLTIVASESALGAKTIAAKYSYVENNVKQVVEMNPAEVNVVAPGTVITETPAIVANPDSMASPKTNTTTVATSGNNEPPGEVSAIRTIGGGSVENEFLITLKIKKGATKGFARYSDDIAEGLIAKSVKTDGGSFSVADGKIKFVWVNVPEKDELEISYTLSGTTSNAVFLGGEYSYLEDNQSKKYKLPPETIAFQAKQTVSVPKQEDNNGNKVETNQNTITETQNKADVVTEKKEGSMNYLVQIGAFTNAKVNSNTLVRKFKIRDKIRSEMQDGYSKFMIGSYSEYKNARTQRETVKSVNGVKSAFVVAYNDGKRITVQEALMITNQKWFK